jgi:hypothetical protein
MDDKKTVVKFEGPSIDTLMVLTIVFITLKLTNVIDWGWGWVLAPLWLPVALMVAVFLLLITAYIIIKILDIK